MHASASSNSSGIQLSLYAQQKIHLHLPTTINIKTTSHITTTVYDAAHDALPRTTYNKLLLPLLVQVSQDACHRPRNQRSPRRRHRHINHLIILQKTHRPESNDHDSTTPNIQAPTKSHSRGYQKHRYHSTATSAVRGGTLKHSLHQTQLSKRTNTDTLGDFSAKSTSQALQKRTVPKATLKQQASPTTANSSGHTDLREGKQAWD